MNRIGDNLQHTGANRRLVEALVEHGVDFILVGGLAVSWYCKERIADDMDILLNPTEENSRLVSDALRALTFGTVEESSFTRCGVQVPLKQDLYADLLTPLDEGPCFEELALDAAAGRLFGFEVKIASPCALIQLKLQATESLSEDADKHMQDIELLRANAV